MEENTQGPNKGINIVVFLIVVLLVVVIALFIHLATDLFKTPEQLFKKYLLNGVVELSQFNIDPYTDILEEAKDESLEFKVQFDYDIPLNNDYFDVEIGENNEIIDSKLTGEAVFKKDKNDEKQSMNIDIKKNQKNFFNIDIVKVGNFYGVGVPEIYENYVAVENKNLKKIGENLGLEQEAIDRIPDVIIEKSSFTDGEKSKLLELATKYTNKIFEQIDDNSYTKENFIITEFDGEAIPGTKFILTIPEENLLEILSETTKELFNDEEFLLILEGKIDQEKLSEFKKNLETDEIFETEENSGNVKISVYKSKGDTVRLKVERETGNTFQATFVNKENSSHIKVEMTVVKTEDEPVGYEAVIDLTNSCENNNGELKLNITNTYNKNDISKNRTDRFSSSISSALFGTDNVIKEYSENKYKDTNITLKLNSASNKKEVSSRLDIEGIDVAENIKLPEILFNLKIVDDIQIPNMDNKILINEYTKKDFNDLGKELGDNIIKVAEEDEDTLVGMIYNSINLYQLSMQSIFDPTIEENETYKKALEKYEAKEYNKEYLEYIGEIDGTKVKKLLSKLASDAVKINFDDEKIPSIQYKDYKAEYIDDFDFYREDNSRIRKAIKNDSNYIVKAYVDDMGYINKIEILNKENS